MIIQIEPWIDKEEMDALGRVVESTFVTEHKLTAEFEAVTRQFTQSAHAISICNGTMALFCCLRAMGIGQGDEVIVPDLTFIATANAVILAGAKPVLCDIDPKSLGIAPDKIIPLINSRTKALLPIHLYGFTADMPAVMDIARTHKLFVIEDAAQAVGVHLNEKHAGTFGDAGVLSYYGNKTVTCGEGGIVLTGNDQIARDVYRLKNHGRDAKGVFMHEHIGFNFSFTEMQAAIGLSQMKKLPQIIKKKSEIDAYYRQSLSGNGDISFYNPPPGCEPVSWFTSIITGSCDTLAKHLKKNNIQTRRFFYPLHLQPCYRNNPGSAGNIDGSFPASTAAYENSLSLPSSYALTTEQQNTVIQSIKDFF